MQKHIQAHRNAKSNDCLMWVDTMWCVFLCFIFYRHRFCLFSSVVLAHYSFYYSRPAQAKVESLLRVSHWQIDGTCWTSSQRLYVCKFKKTFSNANCVYSILLLLRYKSLEYAYLASFFMKLYSRGSRKFVYKASESIEWYDSGVVINQKVQLQVVFNS